MNKPRKAYLIEPIQGRPLTGVGLGVRVSAVVVLDYQRGAKSAMVVPFTVGGTRLASMHTAQSVPVSRLAGTRLKALARVALALRDVETHVAAHLAMPSPAAANSPLPARSPAAASRPESMTPGGPRRAARVPWYAAT